ncbi:amidohydrolase/deacetylase family metallohydrolase [Flavihumibacter sp. CACIAM 22H1]|uniref:amidohydrolase/deacetylase family metallohydrolase n=1 Tax=Flavihumibacter sp. CACIAM 22H1 TaxID=1812911 RepID=UPI0007A7F452|nr:amidohydrolase/deacetylase family metallohydrolase [Flavihumibacter sp. CACIAM 22H1]KYP14362.1 MAG: dihydroorotase [Flavihumibacter sp. CACIAM 22H1]
MKYLLLVACWWMAGILPGYAQPYSVLIKGGRVIDPKNGIDQVMDIGIRDGKIAAIQKQLDTTGAKQVVLAAGMLVVPGLIDIHGHHFFGTAPDHYLSNGLVAVAPDGFTLRNGVTTAVDCGGAGWKNFPLFKQNIIDHSITRVLSFLNIVGEGMRGGAWEQDTTDMNARMAAAVARQYPDLIVGFKVAHYEPAEWIPVDRAVEAGKLARLPVIIDFGGGDHPPLSIEELFFKHLRPGDIYTHAFTELARREPIVDPLTRQLKPFVKKAQDAGILFDVGYGGASFAFSQAIPAAKAGFFPNTISTDLHIGSMNSAMKDMLNVMSTFLALKMDLKAVINAATWAPAQAIQRQELGHLSVGSVADIAVLQLAPGDYGFWDRTGTKITARHKLVCEMTIRAGKIVYDLNGIARPIVLSYSK